MVDGIIVRLRLLKRSTHPIFSRGLSVAVAHEYCFVCGTNQFWNRANVINNELSDTWGLTPKIREAFDCRESMFCPDCSCSYRLRLIAESLVKSYGGSSLRELMGIESFRKLDIAEINSCGKLHNLLRNHPKLSYSEYGSDRRNVKSENLENLSYPNDSYDLVLTSDTLEHIPNIDVALSEIYRVLKPGGKHIFTVPSIWRRKTVNRARVTKGSSTSISNLLPPSYHGEGQPDYLVFNEFGYDFLDKLEQAGFKVKVFKVNLLNLDDANGLIIAEKN